MNWRVSDRRAAIPGGREPFTVWVIYIGSGPATRWLDRSGAGWTGVAELAFEFMSKQSATTYAQCVVTSWNPRYQTEKVVEIQVAERIKSFIPEPDSIV